MTHTSLFDWHIYRDIFATAEMAELFNERATLKCMIEVERALAHVQGELGIIPMAAAEEISKTLNVDQLDLARLREDVVDVGRPVVGLAKQLSEQVSDVHAPWVHYGITTYDVMDTGKVLQIQDGLNAVEKQIVTLRAKFAALADTHRDTVMIGRTNNMHAQPNTFGGKLATWVEELLRHEQRLHEIRKRVLVVQFGGAVGTLASLEDKGLLFRQKVAARLGLGIIQSNWHNSRDSMAEVALCLGNLCASLARMAQNINSLSGTDIAELSEAGKQGRGRSSAMPHKRNPRAAEFAESVARLGQQRAMGLVEIMGQEHDRNGGTYIAEWMMIPDTFLLTSGALSWSVDLIDRLEVHTDRMRRNVDAMDGLALTERYTLALAQHIDKFSARRLMDEAVLKTVQSDSSLSEILLNMPAVTAVLDAAEIKRLSAPETYTGAAGDIVDNVLLLATEKDRN